MKLTLTILLTGALFLAGCGDDTPHDSQPNIEPLVPSYIQTYIVDVPNTQIRYRCIDTSHFAGGLWCERISK